MDVGAVERVDDLVLKHRELFNMVPEYHGKARPKHHFLSHLALNIWNYGPPRGYWCFGFEGFNRTIKAGAKRSHFKGETVACMRFWSMRSARAAVDLYVI